MFPKKLRVLWYLLEVISGAQESSGKGADFVMLCWEKNRTLWDYDRKLGERMMALERWFMPVRLAALHFCCIPRIVVLLLKPIGFAFMGKMVRQRTIIHNATEEQLPEALAGFGILKDMLPTEMGGTITLDHSKLICPPFDRLSCSAAALCQLKSSNFIEGQTKGDEAADRIVDLGSSKDGEMFTDQGIRMQEERPSTDPMELIRKDIKIRPMDILCGRGKAATSHGKRLY